MRVGRGRNAHEIEIVELQEPIQVAGIERAADLEVALGGGVGAGQLAADHGDHFTAGRLSEGGNLRMTAEAGSNDADAQGAACRRCHARESSRRRRRPPRELSRLCRGYFAALSRLCRGFVAAFRLLGGPRLSC